MDIRAIDPSVNGGSYDNNNKEATPPPPPPANDVSAFNQAMGNDSSNSLSAASGSCCDKDGAQAGSNNPLDAPQMKETLTQIIQLIQQLLEKMGGEQGETKGGSTAGPDGGVKPVDGPGPGGSAGTGSGGDQRIPPPTEHIQELNLGGKTVTVGGDGSASAEEVGQTAQSIEHMYQNSPTFKNMIDSSSDPSFEVSVGKRDDNTSWGNSEGRIFMNVNNVSPGNNDAWQSLLSHEFAHASIDIGHGGEMERLEQQAASEA